jgi:hypothetical protein
VEVLRRSRGVISLIYSSPHPQYQMQMGSQHHASATYYPQGKGHPYCLLDRRLGWLQTQKLCSNYYTEATERSPVGGGDSALCFPISAGCQWPMLTHSELLSLAKVIVTDIPVKRLARHVDDNAPGICWRGKYNSLRDTWRQSINGTSFHCLGVDIFRHWFLHWNYEV